MLEEPLEDEYDDWEQDGLSKYELHEQKENELRLLLETVSNAVEDMLSTTLEDPEVHELLSVVEAELESSDDEVSIELLQNFKTLILSLLNLLDYELQSQKTGSLDIDKLDLAQIDSLTKLPNRAAYSLYIQSEFARWSRYRHPLILLMGDLDSLKVVCSEYGKEVGDKLLVMAGEKLKQSVRATDFVARYGDEEFIIVLHEACLEDAAMVANKLRKSIEDMRLNFDDMTVRTTISFGVSEFQIGDNPDSVYARAEDALYDAKLSGGNTVIKRAK